MSDDFSLSSLTADTAPLPDRILLYAPPKWGKTAWAAHAPQPVFLCTRGEDGIHTLKRNGLAPAAVRTFPHCADHWNHILQAIAALIRQPPPTFVLDTLNGAEALCFAAVCQREYGGDWGEKGFSSYQIGYRTTGPREFERLFEGLDRLREAGSRIICLAHVATKTKKNVYGPDYDIVRPVLAEESWNLAARRFDLLVYGSFDAIITKRNPRDPKGKATGGSHRVLHTQPCAAHEAGGRYPLPEQLDGGDSAAQAWSNFAAALAASAAPRPDVTTTPSPTKE